MLAGYSTEESFERIRILTPKTEGDGNPPTIPACAESSSPGYALGGAWGSTLIVWILPHYKQLPDVVGDAMYSDSPTTWPRVTANGKTERLLDDGGKFKNMNVGVSNVSPRRRWLKAMVAKCLRPVEAGTDHSELDSSLRGLNKGR
ncbi:uncharacterized protein F5891DRAFT_1169859 [Suillus fuscotomentosus]|uniref:Uncharacterized protein n=1 Tax=Suillus fuscotomentosus TaxID=1912939 RepID=A0AAD4EHB6_9AGAM|nr:uncharacterized protein F5891DRAFT_1169859 [Suillus fuscotomentosus]KAG1906081.1 hypothetical protein F5891DRAFT_1169859 [Suillus fuscotomentosus]